MFWFDATRADRQAALVVWASSTTGVHGTGYPRDTRLLLLHERKLVDASVLHWVGGTTQDEGSRHLINVKPPDAKTGQQVWHDLNCFNHVAVPAEVTAAANADDDWLSGCPGAPRSKFTRQIRHAVRPFAFNECCAHARS